MKVIRSLSSLPRFTKKTAVTIGVFDGLHTGHLKLLEEVVKCARKTGGKAVVVTFEKHPDSMLGKDRTVKLIKTPEARIKRIKKYGIDMVVVLNFLKISKLSPGEFAEKVLCGRLNTGCFVAGRDFIFGKGGRGNVSMLKRISRRRKFEVKVIDDVKVNGKKVSSTLIRKKLKEGRIKEAEKMLGRKYSIEGIVRHGRHVGFDFPTANIKLSDDIMPASGVWAVLVKHAGSTYTGAANIGRAPTIKRENATILEVHLLGYSGSLYGKRIRVIFLEKIRDEKKFSNHRILVDRVKKDIKIIKEKYGSLKGVKQ